MFISGQQIAEHFRSEEGGTPGWVEAYLRSRFVECCGPNDVVGEPGDIVGDGLAFGLSGGDGADDSESPDVIKPESTEGGRRVSVLRRQEGAPVLLG